VGRSLCTTHTVAQKGSTASVRFPDVHLSPTLCSYLQEAERPATRGRHHPWQRRQQQHIDDSESDDAHSEEGTSEGQEDSDFEDRAAAAAAGADEDAGTGGRSARAGRSLRDTIKKPPPSVSMQGHAGELLQGSNVLAAAVGYRPVLSYGY
jgi:hypothetical protein